MREPIAFDKPSYFGSYRRHYYGYPVYSIPQTYVRRSYWGVNYYIVDDIWYRRHNDSYYVCRPPFGVVIHPVAEYISSTACFFAYYHTVNNLYRQVNQLSRQIAEQNRAIAHNNAIIIQQNAQLESNNLMAQTSARLAYEFNLVQSYASADMEYYYDDGVFYTLNLKDEYVTIVPPAGALVQNLPEDYETIVMRDGREYYKVDNTIYRVSVINGYAYFEVLGQEVE